MKNTANTQPVNNQTVNQITARRSFHLTYTLVWCLFFVLGNSVFAKVYKVGATKVYVTPNALFQANVLQDGDVIEIDAETYTGTGATARWAANNLTIRGVGGRPHLEANGKSVEGKAIWIVAGNDNIIENIEFSGAKVLDKNGAGIRQEGVGVEIRNCYFHHNETNFLSSNPEEGHILIEFSEFSYGGIGNGFTHNVYIGRVSKLTFRYNYSHHALGGQALKSRAANNVILYNRIMDENSGEASRLIDLSVGGFAIIMGNLLMQGTNAQNGNLVGFGPEGLSNPAPHELYFINNTCVNKRTSSANFVFIKEGTSVANVSNNIFTGSGDPFDGVVTTFKGNLIDSSIDNLNFFDESIYDYRLTENSPAIDQGIIVQANPVDAIPLLPDRIYYHPRQEEPRVMLNNTIDVGAYEMNPDAEAYELVLGAKDGEMEKNVFYPNPATHIVSVSQKFNNLEFNIFNSQGQLQKAGSVKDTNIDIASLPNGVYFICVGDEPYGEKFKVIKN